MDTESTAGAALEEEEDAFEDTSELSMKALMFLDKGTNKATKKMPADERVSLSRG